MIDKDKLIYTLPDGSKSYDPLSVRRKLLLASKNQLNRWIELYNDAVEELDRLAAEESLIGVAREAFGLPPLTEKGGSADKTVMEYLSHLLEWLSVPVNQSFNPTSIDTPCLDCPPFPSTTVPNVV